MKMARWEKCKTAVWQKVNPLYEKKRKQLLSVNLIKNNVISRAHCLALRLYCNSIVDGKGPKSGETSLSRYRGSAKAVGRKVRITLIKRKYLRLKGLYRKFKDFKIEILLAEKNMVYSPIEIKYKKINLLYKHRPVAYYFTEANFKTLEFTIVGDVDFLYFPYRTALDFKVLSFMS